MVLQRTFFAKQSGRVSTKRTISSLMRSEATRLLSEDHAMPKTPAHLPSAGVGLLRPVADDAWLEQYLQRHHP